MFRYSHVSLFHFLLLYASLFPCFIAPSCFLVPLMFRYSSASLLPCFIASPMFRHSCGLLFPCLLMFIVSLLMCDTAFVFCNSRVLLLVTLLLLCDATLMFHYSRVSSLFCALGIFLLLVVSLCPCVLPLLCFTAHVFCYSMCFAIHCVLLFPFPYWYYPLCFFEFLELGTRGLGC